MSKLISLYTGRSEGAILRRRRMADCGADCEGSAGALTREK